MKSAFVVVTALLVTGLLGWPRSAAAGYFQDRQTNQRYRIQHGLASGQLTPGEARKLIRDQRHLRQLKRHYLADGRLSVRERRILDRRLDRSSHRIYRYKHNHRWIAKPCYGQRGRGMSAWH